MLHGPTNVKLHSWFSVVTLWRNVGETEHVARMGNQKCFRVLKGIISREVSGWKKKWAGLIWVRRVYTGGLLWVRRWSVRLLQSRYCLEYVVWQKSNETEFLLTMNFILFTNQGYTLQNSSLGQPHSDGGVISIVRSSAGRLLLVYLSARRLRSSGYYPKYQNGALSSGLWDGRLKRSHRDWDPANRGAEEPQECFFTAKNSLMETAVWHGALSWCSIQVRAMLGRTRATLFLILSRTSR